MERLQKIISAAGVASRRKAEELITSGLVQVNGQTVTELGAKADAAKDHIRVNGKLLKISTHHVYILLNKPKGYVTTLSDPEGRPTIVDLLHGVKQRVYPVGRLDYASEGLLLLTNDGELANALTKAASHVPKTYLVKVSGQPSDGAIEQLRAGIQLPDRKGVHSRTAPAGIQLVHKSENPWFEVTLIEGRNRQIRAMFEQTGHHVEKLKRVRYGPFTLDVHPGKHRNLTLEEVEQLRSAVDRGASATAEASVRPPERAESHIEAALREEERSPAQLRSVPQSPEKPRLAPKPVGAFTAKPRVGKFRPENKRPESKDPGGFRRDRFSKKGPHAVKFGGSPRPFDSRGPRPAGSSRPSARPDWKKSAPSGSPPPAAMRTGAPKKWEARGASPKDSPRLFAQRNDRPASPAGRPDWKKSSASRGGAPRPGNARPSSARPGGPKFSGPRSSGPRSSSPRSGPPRKWTQGAPPTTSSSATNSEPRAFDRKPASFGARPDRPSKPRREDSGSERPPRTGSGRPASGKFGGGRPASRSSDSRRPSTARPRGGATERTRPAARPERPSGQKPFWQAADKRRSRKPKAEGDFEPRESRRPNSDRPPRPSASGSARPKFGSAKPGKNRR